MISTRPMNGIAGLMMGVSAMVRMGRVLCLVRRRRTAGRKWEEMSRGEMMCARYVAQATIARRGRGVGGCKAGQVAPGGGAGQWAAASVPWCPTCQGRHLCKTCPNICAKGDPTFSVPAVDRDGATCSYVDPRCPDVVCRGRGHFARHHVQGESEGVDTQKGVSPPRGAAIVRPTAARNDGVPARVGASGPQRGRPMGRGAPGQGAARSSGAVGGRPGGDSSRAVPARPVQPQGFPARVVTFGDGCGDEESGWLGEDCCPKKWKGCLRVEMSRNRGSRHRLV